MSSFFIEWTRENQAFVAPFLAISSLGTIFLGLIGPSYAEHIVCVFSCCMCVFFYIFIMVKMKEAWFVSFFFFYWWNVWKHTQSDINSVDTKSGRRKNTYSLTYTLHGFRSVSSFERVRVQCTCLMTFRYFVIVDTR